MNVEQGAAGTHGYREIAKRMMPLARHEDVVVSEVETDVLVYDRRRHRAHALNRSAALVWRHCDGQTSVGELTNVLKRELEPSADEAVVWLALSQLGKADLLQDGASPAGAPVSFSRSRRELLRRAGVGLVAGALVLPSVQSIVAPTALAAGSCGGLGEDCSGNKHDFCCPGFKCKPTSSKKARCTPHDSSGRHGSR